MNYKELISSAVSITDECGENLEDDASFQNFFFEAEGTPEKFDGQNTIPAEPPEWRTIKKSALEYISKTRDIKLISILAQSVLNTEGVTKFSECLTGLAELVETQWQEVFPPLDEDDGDPLERISALGHLTDKSFVLDILKTSPLAISKVAGKVSLRVIERSKDHAIEKEESDLEPSQIKGIFGDTEQDELVATFEAIKDSIAALTKINNVFVEQAGNNYSVSFDKTIEILTHIEKSLEEYADLHTQVDDEKLEAIEETGSDKMISSPSNSGQSQQNQLSFNDTNSKLTSRRDVDRCFELICKYYEEYEPSSPIPVLMSRAKKFVHMDFLDIIENISPESLTAIMKLGGLSEEDRKKDSSNNQEAKSNSAPAKSTKSVTSDW